MPVTNAAVIEALYAGVLDPEVWQDGLASLAREWDASALVLAAYDGASGERLRVESVPPGDTGLAPLTVQPGEGLSKATSTSSARGLCLHRTRERIVLLWLAGGGGRPVRRTPGPGDPLAVHLVRAMELRERVESVQLHSSMLDASVAQVNIALILIAPDGAVLAHSRLAGRLLDGDCGVTAKDGTLRVTSTGEAIVDPLAPANRRVAEAPLRIARAGRPPLTVLLSAQPGPARWMVVLCDPEAAPEFDLDLIAADLGVSRREAEVAAELCRGLTPAEIARRMAISINTVRSHVKAIYGKAGTHSRVALIRRIATSPAALLRRE